MATCDMTMVQWKKYDLWVMLLDQSDIQRVGKISSYMCHNPECKKLKKASRRN